MMWTPVKLPPHPSHVQSLTPLAQKMLDLIREEGNSRVPRPVPPSRLYENNTLMNGRSEEVIVTPDVIFEDRSFRSKNWSINLPHQKHLQEDTSQLEERIMFHSFPSPTVESGLQFQKNNYHSGFYVNNSKMANEITNFKSASRVEISRHEPTITRTINVHEQLSPDMTFENINIYSNPFAQTQPNICSGEFQYKKPQSKLKPASSNTSCTFTGHQGSINFKEIKIHPHQRTKEGLPTKELSKMTPTDQTFKFANMPKRVSFESKLNKFRVSNQKQPKNSKITSYFKPLEDSVTTISISDEKDSENNKTSNIIPIQNKGGRNNKIEQNNTSEKEYNDSYKMTNQICIENNVYNYLTNERIYINNTNNNPNNDEDKEPITTINNESYEAFTLSEPVESLFVNTQDGPQQKNGQNLNETFINEATVTTEESNIEPCQIQAQATNLQYDFEVDDLFSSDNETATKITHKTNACQMSKTNEGTLYEQRSFTGINQQSMRENMNTDNILQKQNIYEFDKDLPVEQQYNIKQNSVNASLFFNQRAENFNSKDNNIQINKGSQDSIDLNVHISEDKLVRDSLNLKQSTLYDWEMNPSLSDTNNSLIMDYKINTQNNIDVPFKKPLAPSVKTDFTIKRSFNGQSTRPQVKKPRYGLNNLNDNKLTNSNHNSDKLVQTTLVKTETSKVTMRKSRFIAPILSQQSHQTTDNDLEKYTITELDKVNAKAVLHKLTEEVPQKVIITVTFKEGYTLLNKPTESLKNSRCIPSGVMFCVKWSPDHSFHYWLSILDADIADSSVQDTIDCLLSRPNQVICFESQAVFMLLKDVFHFNNISEWFANDPLIGCWLLDPDNPPKDFREVAQQLEIDTNLLTINVKDDPKIQAYNLLPALDKSMEFLKQRLLDSSLWTVFNEMETKLTPVLASMECASILIDVKKLHASAAVLNTIVKQVEKEAHQLAGRHFQLNSHKQLREILFNELKLDDKFNGTLKQTEQGSKSTSEAVLSLLKDYHPLPNTVLEYRHLQKVKSTYVDGLIQHVKPDNTIGTTWEQVGAATGRITSKNPNLQAIPKTPVVLKDGEKIHLRAVFKAREGFSFLAADFQQIEFRVFAHFTQDDSLLQAFQEGGDIFQRLATQWLGDKSEHQREKTKRIVYSIMYGAGPHLLGEYLHVDMSEATHIIKNFTDNFPSLRSLPKKVVAQCRTQGYVVTLSGRRRLFPNIKSPNRKLRSYSERQAINFLIQGSAADICKAAMLDCESAIRKGGFNARLLLQIHDELVWEVMDHQLQDTARAVREAMENRWEERLCIQVPVPVSMSSGKTLADMELLTQ